MQQKLEILPKIDFLKDSLYELPEEPGIYIFWNLEGGALYVGKSISLRKRVLSYLGSNLSSKTHELQKEIKKVSCLRVGSELEALLLEARVVKAVLPKYNIALKDDKHPLYIKITNEKYPQILTSRKADSNTGKNLVIFGPFPSSNAVRSVLKTLRKVFPFAQHLPGKKPCIYSQIGLCDPCPSDIEITTDPELKAKKRKKYNKNIKQVRRILSGNLNRVKLQLKTEMECLAKEENFESANQTKEEIKKLDYITRPQTKYLAFLENPNLIEDTRIEEEKSLRKIISKYTGVKKSLKRIECFDVAHLAGSNPAASMVTFIEGAPEKSLYRNFRIEKKRGGNDLASLREVAERRLRHFGDWGIPDLFLVDGGKLQVGIFWEALKFSSISIVGLAKRYETLVIPKVSCNKLKFIEIRLSKSPALNLVQRIRDEAHRFARKYHHKLVQKEMEISRATHTG